MKLLKLFPGAKRHVVGFPMRVDVDDSLVDIDDETQVRVYLGFQLTATSPAIPSPDLPGTVISGPWKRVAPLIRHVTPTRIGFYTLFVEADFNVAPLLHAPRFLPVTYQTVTVQTVH